MRGIVLEGGGAKGAYQIGAWRALRELGIDFDGVAGTSIGALNGAFFMQDDYDTAYKLWYDMRPSLVIDGDEELMQKLALMDLEGKDYHRVFNSFKKLVGQKGLDITPLRQMIATYLKEDVIRSSPRAFGFMTVSVTDFKPTAMYKEDIPQGQLAEYLIASANLPVFKLDRIDGKLFVDGGFYDNLPVKLLTDKGFDEIITIELNGLGLKQKWQTKDHEVKHIAIRPSGDLGGTLEFLPQTARRNMAMGYYDTQKVYKGLRGQRYYIDCELPEQYYLEWLCRLPQSVTLRLAELMGIVAGDSNRLLFEQILPKFYGLLKLGPEAGYRDLVLALLEHIAESLTIDRYAIFKDNEFMQKVVYELNQRPGQLVEQNQSLEKLPKIIKQSKLYQGVILNSLAFGLLEGLLQDNR